MNKTKNTYWDVCHIMHLKKVNFWTIPFLRARADKIIVSVFARATYMSFINRNLFALVYRYVDLITFTSSAIADEFKDRHPKITTSKIETAIFTVPHYRELDYIVSKGDKNKIYDELGLDRDLIHVACSSTVSKNDQHEAVIKAIKGIKNKDKVQLLFLLTYGGSQRRKDMLKELIKKELYGFNYVIYDSYMTSMDIAKYRAITDIYINMRAADQFAGAIIESLYAGAYLISGSWLNYGDLDDLGVEYYQINRFEELSDAVDKSIINLDCFNQQYSSKNSKTVYDAFMAPHNSKVWDRIYTRLQQCP
jgi:glycosyltransferase involved in cell wall biosynthesis